jgi:FkbM family methyltransferase
MPQVCYPLCMEYNYTTYAQNFEDIYIYKFFQLFRNYYENFQDWENFIDIGVWEPVQDNVSKHFIDLNWRGLLVEANPDYVERLKKEYSKNQNLKVLNYAVSSSTEESMTLFIPEKTTGWASLNEAHVKQLPETYRKLNVSTITLNKLIELLDKKIFYIKIDVETYEEEILRTFINKSNVVIFVLEGINENIVELMLKKDYTYAFNDGINGYFVNNLFNKISKPSHFNVVNEANWRISPGHWLAQDLMGTISRLSAENNRLLESINVLSDENGKILNELSLILNSRSMKLTSPLRKLKKLFI